MRASRSPSRGPKGRSGPAGNRALYFPITVIEPFEYTTTMRGLDLYSVPSLKPALEHAIATGKTTASTGTLLPPSTSHGPLCGFRTVYQAQRGASKGRGELLGIVAVAFRIDQMVDLSLKDLSPAAIDDRARECQAPPGQQSLYYRKAEVAGLRGRIGFAEIRPHLEHVPWRRESACTVLQSLPDPGVLSPASLVAALDAPCRRPAAHRPEQSLFFPEGFGERPGWNCWCPSERVSWPMRSQSTSSLGGLAESRSTLARQGGRLNVRNQEVQLSTKWVTCSNRASPRKRPTR